jgi:hypothetical protein
MKQYKEPFHSSLCLFVFIFFFILIGTRSESALERLRREARETRLKEKLKLLRGNKLRKKITCSIH